MSFEQHQLDNDFRHACSLGNLQEVQRNINDGIVDVNSADKWESFTGLHFACENGQSNIVQFLLQSNANVNAQNSLMQTPLILILKEDKKRPIQNKIRNEIIRYLLQNDANSELGHGEHKNQPKAIHCAARLGDVNCIRQLLEYESTLVNSTDRIGRYPIHHAAYFGKVWAMQELLECGSDLQPIDNQGWTPFHVACDRFQLDCVQYILDQGGHMHTKTKSGDQAIHIACRHKTKETVPVVQFLIMQGADIDVKDSMNLSVKQYIKENILLKNVISNAKKKRSKFHQFGKQSNYNTNNNKRSPKKSTEYDILCSASFGVIDLRGNVLYSAAGYKLDHGNPNKVKRISGNIKIHEHGLLFTFKTGYISKTTNENFHPWQPNVELKAHSSKSNVLLIDFINTVVEEELKSNVVLDQFGIEPCRPRETIEIIRRAINKMFPIYSLKNDIKKFLSSIANEAGVLKLVSDFELSRSQLQPLIENAKQLQLQINKYSSVDENDENIINLQQKYDKCQSEISNIQINDGRMEEDIISIWNECRKFIVADMDPLIIQLSADIDSKMQNNEHWKIIGNLRRSLSFVKKWKRKLISIRGIMRYVMIQKLLKENKTNVNGNNSNVEQETCVICVERLSNVKFLPCMHVVVCDICLETNPDPGGIKFCPICKRDILKLQKL